MNMCQMVRASRIKKIYKCLDENKSCEMLLDQLLRKEIKQLKLSANVYYVIGRREVAIHEASQPTKPNHTTAKDKNNLIRLKEKMILDMWASFLRY